MYVFANNETEFLLISSYKNTNIDLELQIFDIHCQLTKFFISTLLPQNLYYVILNLQNHTIQKVQSDNLHFR